jgi:hypothetical protein
MSYGPIPFEIPLRYLSQVDAGEIVRYGTVLKDVSSGKIVGHLQQTGLFDHVLGNAVAGLGQVVQSGTSPINLLTGVGTVIQNEQIKGKLTSLTDMVSGLQTLGLVSSVASIAGIGVTVASTMILMQRIKKVDESIGRMEGQIAGMAEHLQKTDIHKALRKVNDTMEKLAEAPHRKTEAGTRKVLDDVEENLRSGFNELVDGARVVINLEVLDEELLRTLLAGIATCAAAQSKTLIWLDELPLALNRAKTQTSKLSDLARAMPLDMMQAKLGGDVEAAARLSTDLRELRAVAAGRPSFCERLSQLEVSGPDYLAQAQERDDAPVVMLPSG